MNESNIKEKDRVHSRKGHFLYSLGAVPSALPYNMIQSFFVFFYLIYAGLSLELTGLLLILYGIWNAINDPLIGYYMDKKKTRWGRRVPYIVIGTIPLTIGFILLWWVPWSDQITIFLHGLIMLFLFDLGFTLAITAWSSLYTEMYETEEERATVVAIKDSIAFLSAMIGVIIPPLIATALGWPVCGILFGIMIPITMYLSLLGTKERKEYQIDEPLPFVAAFKETFTNKPFVNITLTYTMIDFVFGLTMMALPLYARFVLKMDEALVGFAALGVVLGLFISVPFWRWMYAKKGPKFGLLLAMGIFALGIWPVFLVSNFIMLFFLTIFPGFGVGGMIMTEPAISAAIDFDELKTGKRREASYNGILTLIARLSIVFSGLSLIIIHYMFGFESGSEAQTSSAIFGLKLLVSIIPFIGILLGLLIFKFFPINYKKFCDMQEKLKVLHEKRLLKIEKT